MASIYECAQTVPIWLGPATDNSDLAMDLLSGIGECIYETRKPGGEWDFATILEWLCSQKGAQLVESKVTFDEEIWTALLKLLRRPWWTRVWIAQEATVRDNMKTFVLCGGKAYNWLRLGCALHALAPLANPLGFASLADGLDAPITLIGFQMRRMNGGESLHLFNLLIRFRNHKATDERDLVYALMSMAREADGKKLPEPDYKKKIDDIYREVAEYIICTSPYGQTLDILGYADDFDFRVPEAYDKLNDEFNLSEALSELKALTLERNFSVDSEQQAHQVLQPLFQALKPLIHCIWASSKSSRNEAGVFKLTTRERGFVEFLLDVIESGPRHDDEFSLAEKKKWAEFGTWFKTLEPDLLDIIIRGQDLLLSLDPVMVIDLIASLSDAIDHMENRLDWDTLNSMNPSEFLPDSLAPEAQNWPSWVPDWRLSSVQSDPLSKRREIPPTGLVNDSVTSSQSLYSASGRDKATITNYIGASEMVSFDCNDVLIHGFQIDTIRELRSLILLSWTSDSELEAQLNSWVTSIIGLEYNKGKQSESVSDALSRTLVADVTSTSLPMARLTQPTAGIVGPKSFDACTGRLLTITDDGLIGLVPLSAKADDKIYLLAGGQIFYVLRPEGDNFRLIGESYIHGLMDGEALERLEEGKAQLREVRIR